MRIVLAPIGARGDVLPMLAVAKVLHERGHVVTLCVPETFRPLVMKQGFQMVSCGSGFQQYLAGTTDLRNGRALIEALKSEIPVQFVSLRDALREADVLVGSMLQMAGPSMAEQLGLPYFYVHTSPALLDRKQHPSLGVPYRSGILAALNRKSLAREWDAAIGEKINREREFSGLNPITEPWTHFFESGRTIIAMESEFVPQRMGLPTTGFLFFDQETEANPDVEKIFASGLPVVYVGDMGENTEIVRRSVHQAECVLLENHLEFLPRATVALHQGTTEMSTSCLRAGVPQVIFPSLVDQFMWAETLSRLGLAKILDEIQDYSTVVPKVLQDPDIKARATSFGEKIRARAPDGASAAADAILNL